MSTRSGSSRSAKHVGARRNLRSYLFRTPYLAKDLHREFSCHALAKRLNNEQHVNISGEGGSITKEEIKDGSIPDTHLVPCDAGVTAEPHNRLHKKYMGLMKKY